MTPLQSATQKIDPTPTVSCERCKHGCMFAGNNPCACSCHTPTECTCAAVWAVRGEHMKNCPARQWDGTTKVTPTESWEEVKDEWERHPVLERILAMESFVQHHGWGGYNGETISEFWLKRLDLAFKAGERRGYDEGKLAGLAAAYEAVIGPADTTRKDGGV